MVHERQGHHGLDNGRRANTHTGVMTTVGGNINRVALDINRLSRQTDARSRFQGKADHEILATGDATEHTAYASITRNFNIAIVDTCAADIGDVTKENTSALKRFGSLLGTTSTRRGFNLGGPASRRVPAILTPGERVITPPAASREGLSSLRKSNQPHPPNHNPLPRKPSFLPLAIPYTNTPRHMKQTATSKNNKHAPH